MPTPKHTPYKHFLSLLFLLTLSLPSTTPTTLPPPSTLPSDAVALLSFKFKADLDNTLLYTITDRFDYCQWRGVKCVQSRVIRLDLRSSGLRGSFPPDTLTRLDQLRVLSLRNNSLTGPIPDLAQLVNLKSLLLDQNSFSGDFPPSILSLHRLLILDLSHNNFSGSIPTEITVLDRLNYLKLDSNRFNGTIPPLNQSSLTFLNVSNNNLTGAIPVTPTLSRFRLSSFAFNPNLCGEIINKECRSDHPFFNSSSSGGRGKADSTPPPPTHSQGVVLSPPSSKKHNRGVGVALGFIIGALFLLVAVLCLFALFKKLRNQHSSSKSAAIDAEAVDSSRAVTKTEFANIVTEKKEKTMEITTTETRAKHVVKSGNLVFCSGEEGEEERMYDLEKLMRASAELLGRGSIGTTYKAVMNNGVVVTVKRLDAGKTAITSGEMFERHMKIVGGLKHPNLVPIRAYFQAKEERLVIYDYQANGSLFNLIHGSRSTRAKPLHWTSCLKIAEDVSQGLAYIHQASKLIHGNLKSSNVLLGSDFEACLTDYSLSLLADSSSSTGDPDSEGYKAPEIRKSASRASQRATPKSDVYAFGILLLELLTGKPPSQHPFLSPADMWDWVVAMREEDCGDDNRLCMLVEVAGICSLTSPEQRPLMWQVLKMVREVKESVVVEDDARNT